MRTFFTTYFVDISLFLHCYFIDVVLTLDKFLMRVVKPFFKQKGTALHIIIELFLVINLDFA